MNGDSRKAVVRDGWWAINGPLWVMLLVAMLLWWDPPRSTTQAQAPGFRSVSLNAATTGTGTAVNVAGRAAVVFYLRGTGTISSGVVTLEEADYNPQSEAQYAGTWSSITTLNTNTVTAGAQVAYHLPLGAYRYVRARISTTVAGGGNVTGVFAGH